MFDLKLKYTIELENLVNAELEKIEAATDITALKIKEGFDEAGTAVTGVQKCFEDLNKVQGGLGEKAAEVEERFKAFSSSAKELVESVNQLNDALKGGEEKEEEGLFSEEIIEKYKGLLGEKYSAEKAHSKLLKGIYEGRNKIVGTAYSSMQKQMLSFVETGKFSLKGFGDVIAQQVKIELAGLAAQAAVKAIYFTAVGFGNFALQRYDLAGAAFTSAAFFGAVSAASLAAASQVQSSFFGGRDSGSGGGTPAAASMTDAVPLNNNSSQETTQTQQITLNIYNPLSEQNWQEIAENNIIPALKDASERNIELTVVTV
jgi:hypothetical protein